MGGGDNAVTETTVRFPPYLESAHKEFLDRARDYRDSLLDDMDANGSPWGNYTFRDIEISFFGSGYIIDSFPSLYDMYGKFMAGLDVEVLFDQALEDTINNPTIDNLASAEATRLSDDLTEEAYPRFQCGMRDINSVLSSTFVVGMAMMETGRTKALARFDAEIRYRLYPIIVERWRGHLDWNRAVIDVYAQIMKLYYSCRIDMDNHFFDIRSKDKLWPLTLLQFHMAALGAVTGPHDARTETTTGVSHGQKMAGGAMLGAAAGAPLGPIGMGIGAAVGFFAGLF